MMRLVGVGGWCSDNYAARCPSVSRWAPTVGGAGRTAGCRWWRNSRRFSRSVCYECKDSKGQKIERCYDVQARKAKTRKKKASSSSSSTPTASQKRKPRSQQSQQSEQEQRIYKRTISYSYAQGTDQQQEEQPPPDGTTTDLPVPRQRRRRLVKITRRRGPVRVQ